PPRPPVLPYTTLSRSEQAQAVAAIQHAHVLVVLPAASAQPEPVVVRQSSDQEPRLPAHQFLGADQVRVGIGDHAGEGFATRLPADRKSTRLNSSHVKI